MAKIITPPPNFWQAPLPPGVFEERDEPVLVPVVNTNNETKTEPQETTIPPNEPPFEVVTEPVKIVTKPAEVIVHTESHTVIEPTKVVSTVQKLIEDTTSPTHSYQYGIKQISLGNTSYQNNGIFVTKPIEIEGNVMSLSLRSHEEHPLFDGLGGSATDRFTSVEYYVSYKENPTLQDWLPILPEDMTEIKCERLFVKQNTADLRFIADLSQPISVYRNGIKLEESEYYFLAQGRQLQLKGTYDPFAIYTINYTPSKENQDPWNIHIDTALSKRIRQIDTFASGTDRNNTITLSRYPYIDFEKVQAAESFDPNEGEYRPFDVYLKDASIALGNGTNAELVLPKYFAQEEPFTVNRTDYKTRKEPILSPYSLPKNIKQFEYKQYQNKIVFTEPFNRSNLYYNEANAHGNATIEVQYEYLVTSFRLKIIMRCNHQYNVGTPLLNDYSLQFRIMK
jgi:hypothetical protein